MKTRTVQLGEVCEFIRGVTFPSGEGRPEHSGDTVACLTTSGVQQAVAWASRRFIPRERIKNAKQVLQSGDILISTANSKELVGKSCIVGLPPFECTFGAFVTVARSTEEADPRFLAFWMASAHFQAWCYRMSSNTTNISNLRVSELEEMPLPLPSLPEQRRIAALLEQADRLRRTRRYALELSDTFLPAAFLEMFGDPVRNPKGWPEAALSELIRKHDKINYGVVQPGVDLVEGVPIIRVADLHDLPASRTGLKLIAAEIDERHAASRLVGDEVLIACVGSIGKVAKAEANLRGCNIARAVARVPGDWDLVSRDFLVQYLATARVHQYWTDETRTVSQPTLNILQIEETPVLLPPLPLQQRFADLVRGHERLRAAQRESLRQAEHLFQSLLHRAFAEGIEE
ncbi:MAG: restriction endonuclease subunit S [Kiritimatiellia bacterium]